MQLSPLRVVPLCVVLALLAGCGKPAHRPASALSAIDHEALAAYESLRVALATDNLRNATRAAGDLLAKAKTAPPSDKAALFLKPAEAIAQCTAIDKARDLFKPLSSVAIALAGDVEGFYVMTSPMGANTDWLQTTPEVDNPYFGKAMHSTGDLKK